MIASVAINAYNPILALQLVCNKGVSARAQLEKKLGETEEKANMSAKDNSRTQGKKNALPAYCHWT